MLREEHAEFLKSFRKDDWLLFSQDTGSTDKNDLASSYQNENFKSFITSGIFHPDSPFSEKDWELKYGVEDRPLRHTFSVNTRHFLNFHSCELREKHRVEVFSSVKLDERQVLEMCGSMGLDVVCRWSHEDASNSQYSMPSLSLLALADLGASNVPRPALHGSRINVGIAVTLRSDGDVRFTMRGYEK